MFFFPPLQQGILLQRYKRFLADIQLQDGRVITVHCPNTGAMRGCSTPGSLAAFSVAANPRRKYPHTLEMVQENGVWVGVNTARSNMLVYEAILDGSVSQWQDIVSVEKEVCISSKTRLDLCLTHGDGSNTMVEIKSCSLAENGVSLFPDAVTARGSKHLQELTALANAGQKSALFCLVQRGDTSVFRPAGEIDRVYEENFVAAQGAGVQILVYQVYISPEKIEICRQLPLSEKYRS